MLGKLLKHEWSATAGKYGLLYLILGAVTLVTAVMHRIPTGNVLLGVVDSAMVMIYILSLMGVFFLSLVMAVVRFYKNMVSEEGYLTFTLPVKVEELVFSKLVVAFCWQAVTIVLCLASLICVFLPGDTSLSLFWNEIMAYSGLGDGVLGAVLVLIPVSIVYQMLVYYVSIAAGQMLAGHKILGAVIAYCLISFVIELVMALIIIAILLLTGLADMSMMTGTTEMVTAFYWAFAGLSAGMAVVAYFVTCYLLKKKLNLD